MFRKLHNLNKKNKYIYISMVICFTFILLILSYAYSFSNTKLDINTISKINYSNMSSDKYNVTLASTWESNGLYFFQYNIDFKYTEIVPSTGWTTYIRVPIDSGDLACYGVSTCNINNTLLSLKNPAWQSNIKNGDSISLGFQISTMNPNYVPNVVSVFYNKESLIEEDLFNTPYKENIPGEIDEETTDKKLAYNFNDNNTYDWYLENGIKRGSLIDFNGGKALGIYLDNGESFNLKNDTLISQNYKLINYKIYIPRVSNIENIIINGNNINTYKVTEDNRYNVFNYTKDFNSPYLDSININKEYKGYILLDSIYLNNIDDTPNDNFIDFKFTPVSGWGNITQYDVLLTNKINSNINIIDWKIWIYIPTNCSLVTSWIGNTILTDDYLLITPNSWQSELAPGGQASGGIQIENPNCPGTCNTKYKMKVVVNTKELQEVEFNYE